MDKTRDCVFREGEGCRLAQGRARSRGDTANESDPHQQAERQEGDVCMHYFLQVCLYM